MVWSPNIHRLSTADIAALAAGEFPAETIQILQAAELSKHVLLLEALSRTIRRRSNHEGARLLEKSIRILSEVQIRAPEVVADILGLPHFGLWVTRCIFQLRNRATSNPESAWLREFGHLAAFAAVSALRIGYPFDLAMPISRGSVTFPALGTALVGRPSESGWARIRLDRQGATVRSAVRTVSLPAGRDTSTCAADPRWRPAIALKAVAGGISLNVILETSEPLLTHLNRAASPRPRPSRTFWQQQIEGAWQILVRRDWMTAAALASVLSTLVPLEEPRTGGLVSATSGWAWGAIAMSLPADISLVAETLEHEFHHLVLAAAEDLTPLVRQDDGRLYYAPWRDDPRPVSALMQGTYAHLGVAGFWRRQRRAAPPGDRLLSEVKFARAHHAALDAARTLAEAGTLTTSGRALTTGMLSQLEAWGGEPVSTAAETAAAEIRAEHQLRWRLAHLDGDASAIDTLARTWLAGEHKAPPGPIPSYGVIPYKHRLKRDLSELLEMRYRDPLRFARLLNEVGVTCPCHAALLKGDYVTARDGYARLIRSSGERGAWVGLHLARRRILGASESSAEQPEVIADVHDRVVALAGTPPEAEALITWLSGLRAPAQ